MELRMEMEMLMQIGCGCRRVRQRHAFLDSVMSTVAWAANHARMGDG